MYHITSSESTTQGWGRPCSVTTEGARHPRLPALPLSHQRPVVPKGLDPFRTPCGSRDWMKRQCGRLLPPLTREKALSQTFPASFPSDPIGLRGHLLEPKPMTTKGKGASRTGSNPRGLRRTKSEGPLLRGFHLSAPDVHTGCPRFQGPPRRPQVSP